jgi:hypothetical protein
MEEAIIIILLTVNEAISNYHRMRNKFDWCQNQTEKIPKFSNFQRLSVATQKRTVQEIATQKKQTARKLTARMNKNRQVH